MTLDQLYYKHKNININISKEQFKNAVIEAVNNCINEIQQLQYSKYVAGETGYIKKRRISRIN